MIGIRQIKSIYVTLLETKDFDQNWMEREALSHWDFDGKELNQIKSIPKDELDKKHHFSTTPVIEYFVNDDQTQIAVAVFRGFYLNARAHREKWNDKESKWERTYTWIS